MNQESLILSGMRKRLCFIKGFEQIRGGLLSISRPQDCGKLVLGEIFSVLEEIPGFGDGFGGPGSVFHGLGMFFHVLGLIFCRIL